MLQADPFRQTIGYTNPDIRLREVVDLAAEKMESKFADDPIVAAAIYRVLSTAYNNLGEYNRAIELANREIAIREMELGVKHPTSIDARSRLGLFLKNNGSNERAIIVLEGELNRCREYLSTRDVITIETLSRLARAYMVAKEYDKAISLLKESLPLQKDEHGERDSRVTLAHAVLGSAYSGKGSDTDAMRQFHLALSNIEESNGRTNPFVELETNLHLARHLLARKRPADAEAHFSKAWSIAKTSLGFKHRKTKEVGESYSDCLYDLRNLDVQQQVLNELVDHYPKDLGLLTDLAGNLCNSGVMSFQAKRPETSIEFGEQAVEILDKVLRQEPNNSRASRFRVNSRNMLGQALAATGEYDRSTAVFEHAIDDLESQVTSQPKDPDNVSYLAFLYRQCGDSLLKLNQLEKAVKQYDRASELGASLLKQNPDTDTRELVEVLSSMISIYMRLQKAADAVRVMDRLAAVPGIQMSPQKETLREMIRAYVYALDEEHSVAVETADRYWLEKKEELTNVPPVVWTWAASAYALSAKAVKQDKDISESTRTMLEDEYGERAVSVLRHILASDEYSSSRAQKGLLNDKDYSILRHRDDFQTLFPD